MIAQINTTIQDNLQKTLHSYSIRLESVDSGQPATKEYVCSSDHIGMSRLILRVSDSVQQGRIWNCVVTPATCKDISLSDNTEISKTDNCAKRMLKPCSNMALNFLGISHSILFLYH